MINRRSFFALLGSLPVIGTLAKADPPPALLNIPGRRELPTGPIDEPSAVQPHPKPAYPDVEIRVPGGYFHRWDGDTLICQKCRLTMQDCIEHDVFNCAIPDPVLVERAPAYRFNNDTDMGAFKPHELSLTIGGRSC